VSTGTKDFIDEAVVCMQRGDHAFVLLVLDRTGPDSNYSIRTGAHDTKDVRHMQSLLREQVIPNLAELGEDFAE
jgi:hypothetical protein